MVQQITFYGSSHRWAHAKMPVSNRNPASKMNNWLMETSLRWLYYCMGHIFIDHIRTYNHHRTIPDVQVAHKDYHQNIIVDQKHPSQQHFQRVITFINKIIHHIMQVESSENGSESILLSFKSGHGLQIHLA